MRLRPPGDFRPEQQDTAFSDWRGDDLVTVLSRYCWPHAQPLLRGAGLSNQATAFTPFSAASGPSRNDSAVVEEDVHAFADAVRQRMRVVDPRFENGARDDRTCRRQGPLAAVVRLDERALTGSPKMRAE